jgi:glycosyltransferase involved in cell wall biosynthesis
MGRKTRILHVTSSFFSGGIESYLLNFLGHADFDRFEHVLFVGRDDGPLKERYHRLPVSITELKCTPKRFFYSLPYGAYVCRKHGVDVIHGHNYWFYRYAYFLSLLTGIPLVTSNYGLGLWKKKRHLLFESLVFRRAKLNLSISRAILERERSLLGSAKENDLKCRLIYPIIDETPLGNVAARDPAAVRRKIGIANDRPVFTIVGRIDKLKGHRLALDAAARINAGGLRINLLIVGASGAERVLGEDDLRRDYVKYLDYYEPIEDIWSVSDFFLIPSLSEGTPLVLVEYLALGKPVIASDISGNSELITDGWNGRLFQTGSVEDLAKKIEEVLEAGPLSDVRAHAREFYLQHLSPEKLTRAIEGYYREIV